MLDEYVIVIEHPNGEKSMLGESSYVGIKFFDTKEKAQDAIDYLRMLFPPMRNSNLVVKSDKEIFRTTKEIV